MGSRAIGKSRRVSQRRLERAIWAVVWLGLAVAAAALATGILNKPPKPIMSDPVRQAVEQRKAAFREKAGLPAVGSTAPEEQAPPAVTATAPEAPAVEAPTAEPSATPAPTATASSVAPTVVPPASEVVVPPETLPSQPSSDVPPLPAVDRSPPAKAQEIRFAPESSPKPAADLKSASAAPAAAGAPPAPVGAGSEAAESGTERARTAVPALPARSERPAAATAAAVVPSMATPQPTTRVLTAIARPPELSLPRLGPSPDTSGPALAVIIDDVGPSFVAARSAIGLPAPVTLSFLPYADDLPALASAARARGHEIFVHLPMEPVGTEDPGPNALLSRLNPSELLRRTDWALDRVPGAVGMNNHMGSRLSAQPEPMRQVLEQTRRRGLVFVDSRTSAASVAYEVAVDLGVPATSRDVFLDNDQTTGAVLDQLEAAERLARRTGTALAIGHPHAGTLAALARWLPGARERGLQIVTVRRLIELRTCSAAQITPVSACASGDADCGPRPAC